MSYKVRDLLFNKIIESIEASGLNPYDLWRYLGRTGENEEQLRKNTPLYLKKVDNFIKNMDEGFIDVAQNPGEKFIKRPWVTALVYVFRIPVEMIKDVIDPLQLPFLTPDGNLEALVFPIVEGKLDDQEFEETVKRYINQAQNRIWVSEYLPGIHRMVTPKRSVRESWVRTHRSLYEAINLRMKENPSVEYRRILRTYVNSRKEPDQAIFFHAIANAKRITARHMANLQATYPSRVSLNVALLTEPTSYALIDDKFLIKESYRATPKEGRLTYQLHKLSVERLGRGRFLRREFNHYEREFGDIIERRRDSIDFTRLDQLKKDGQAHIDRYVDPLNYGITNKTKPSNYVQTLKGEFCENIDVMITSYDTAKSSGLNI